MAEHSTKAADATAAELERLRQEVASQRAELERAREGVARLDAVLASAADYAIFTTDPSGRVTSWNSGARSLLGWDEAEALGMDSRVMFTPEDRERGAAEAEMATAAAEGRAADERWHMRKDGSRFRASGVLTPLRNSPRPGFLKVMRDVTEQVTAAAELAAAHRRVSEILESIADGFYAVDQAWRLTYVNRSGEKMWGRPREELLGRDLWDLAHPDDREGSAAYRLHKEAARERRPVHGEYRSATLGFWIGVSIYPHAEGLSVYFRDISDRKEAEQRQGLLLRELSHRVKNTLALILSMARQTGLRSATVVDFMDTFEGRLEALAGAHELLTESGWQSTSLAALVEAALVAHDGTRIRTEIEELALLPAAAQDLVLILHELGTNAAKHGALSVPGGTVTLEGRAENGELLLCWRETGGPPVVPPSERGFGTTLLEQVVAYRHAGSVKLDWRPEGLVCTIRLPLAEVADPPPAPETPQRSAPTRQTASPTGTT